MEEIGTRKGEAGERRVLVTDATGEETEKAGKERGREGKEIHGEEE